MESRALSAVPSVIGRRQSLRERQELREIPLSSVFPPHKTETRKGWAGAISMAAATQMDRKPIEASASGTSSEFQSSQPKRSRFNHTCLIRLEVRRHLRHHERARVSLGSYVTMHASA